MNSLYLGAVVSDRGFASDPKVKALLDEMSRIMATKRDLATVTSRRGLYVTHNSAPIRFIPAQLRTILTDPTTYKWPSGAIDSRDPEQLTELPDRTFARAIGDRLVSAYDDTDTRLAVDEPLAGGNSRLPDYVIPFEL